MKENVAALYKELDDPVMIIKSNANENNADILVVTSLTDNDGNPIVAAIKPSGEGNYLQVRIEANILLSGYGKNNFFKYLAIAQNENRILYVNKNSQQKHNSPGLQLSDSIMSADYNNSLAHYKSIVKSILPEKSENDTKFSLKENVEYGKHLIAVHNIDSDDSVIEYTDDEDRIAKMNELDDVKFSIKEDVDNSFSNVYNEEKIIRVDKQTYKRVCSSMNELFAEAFNNNQNLPSHYLLRMSDGLYNVQIVEYGHYYVSDVVKGNVAKRNKWRSEHGNVQRVPKENNRDNESYGQDRRGTKSVGTGISGNRSGTKSNAGLDRGLSKRGMDQSGDDRYDSQSGDDSKEESPDKLSLVEDIPDEKLFLAQKAFDQNKTLKTLSWQVQRSFKDINVVDYDIIKNKVAKELFEKFHFNGTREQRQDISRLYRTNSRYQIDKRVRAAQERMLDRGEKVDNKGDVKTKVAYEAWGIDIKDLERKYKTIQRLGLRGNLILFCGFVNIFS